MGLLGRTYKVPTFVHGFSCGGERPKDPMFDEVPEGMVYTLDPEGVNRTIYTSGEEIVSITPN
jgi:hypothetical protein